MTHWKEKVREIYKGIMVRAGEGYPPPTGKQFVRLFQKFNKRGVELKELLEVGITTEERQRWFQLGLKLKVKHRFRDEIKALQSVLKRLASSKSPEHFKTMFKDAEWNFYFGNGRVFSGLPGATMPDPSPLAEPGARTFSREPLRIALMSTILANEEAQKALDKAPTVEAFFDETRRRAEEKLAAAQKDADGTPLTEAEAAELQAIFGMVDPNAPSILRPDGTPADGPVHIATSPQPIQPPGEADGMRVIIADDPTKL
jgi:hypothetical protein